MKKLQISTWKIGRRRTTLLLAAVALSIGGITPATAAAKESAPIFQKQSTTIKINIKDQSGLPLPGATIKVLSSGRGTSTNANGEASIEANAIDVLECSFIGYTTQQVKINGQSVINITLTEDLKRIDEVVIVAYGTQKKTSVTGSVSTLKTDKLKDVTTPDIGNMLQGKVAGVVVTNASGAPGSSPNIIIRGKGSLNQAVDPLWVVDGIVGAISPNPNDIETITVLKDASATALYGSRGTNGVIMVTTKRGKSGVSRITASAVYGSNMLSMGNFKMMNSQELYDYQKTFNIQPWFTPNLLKTDTDWFKQGTHTGNTQNYNVAYSNSNEKSNNYISADFYTEDGAVKGKEYSRYSGRWNNDYKVSRWFTIRSKVAGSYTEEDDKEHSLYSMLLYLPWDKPYNADGSIRSGKEDDWIGRDKSNYLYDLQWNYGNSKAFAITTSVGFDAKLTDFLSFESNNSINYYISTSKYYTDKNSYSGMSDEGSLYNDSYWDNTVFTNQLLKFNKAFGKHRVDALLGYEYSRNSYDRFSATGAGIPSGYDVLDVTAKAKKVSGNTEAWKIQSYLFNANYNYDDKYMAQLSARRDGSSKFGKDNRFGNFYTISAGWNVHQERFFEPLKSYINTLKLRASYGSVGNTPNSRYSHLGLYSLKFYNGSPAFFPAQLANTKLTWEKAYTSNFAIDARLFNRIDLNIDLYDKNTSGLLYYVTFPSVSGYDGQYQNIGALNNRGLEVTVNANIITKKDLFWNVDFNIGFNKNKIKELYNHKPINGSGYKRMEEGYDMDSWYMREWAGVNPADGSPLWWKDVKDANGNITGRETTSSYNSATQYRLGSSSSPKFSGGFGTSVGYKGITLAANFGFLYGNKIYHAARELFDNDGGYSTYNSMELKSGWSRWEKPGDIATHPKAVEGGNNLAFKPSSRYLEDGSFLRLRNVTLSYTIPSNIIKKIKLNGAKVYISGDNLLTFTGFSGIDPEVGATIDKSDAGSSYGVVGAGRYPMVKKVILGINIDL